MLTLHHLQYSRSSRVLFLLEELQIPYRLVVYERDAAFRAPKELEAVHPLGKAPVIEDGALKLVESAVILSYLNDRYGSSALTPAIGTHARAKHDEWLHYAESSAALPLVVTLMDMMLGGVSAGVGQFVAPELDKVFRHLGETLSHHPYLLGDELSLADIQFSYLIDLARSAGLLERHLLLRTYLERMLARPAFRRALEKGGPMVPSAGLQSVTGR
jgi:glutathione S-transferase